MLEKLVLGKEKIKKGLLSIVLLAGISLTGCLPAIIRNPTKQFLMPRETEVIAVLPSRDTEYFSQELDEEEGEKESMALYLVNLENIKASKRLCFVKGKIVDFSLSPSGKEITYIETKINTEEVKVSINCLDLETRKSKVIDTLEEKLLPLALFSGWIDHDTFAYGYIKNMALEAELQAFIYESKRDSITKIAQEKINQNIPFFPIIKNNTLYFLSSHEDINEGSIPVIIGINLRNNKKSEIYLPPEITEIVEYVDFDIHDKKVALTTDEGLWLIDNNGEKEQIQASDLTQFRFPVWSPDGKKIAFCDQKPDDGKFVSHIYVYSPDIKVIKSVFAVPNITDAFINYEWINNESLWLTYFGRDMFVQSKIQVDEPLNNEDILIVPTSYIALSKLYGDIIRSYRTNREIVGEDIEWCEELTKPYKLNAKQWINLLMLYGYEDERIRFILKKY